MPPSNEGFKAGSVSSEAAFSDSMAEEIEAAYKEELQAAGLPDLDEVGKKERRVLFAAVAKGVLRHLRDKANQGVKISVESDQTSPKILSSGATVGQTSIQVNVSQLDGNLVKTEGSATSIDVEISDT